MPMACRFARENGCGGGGAAVSMMTLSLAPVTPGFALLAADFAPAPWLGHAGISFPDRQGRLR